MNLKVVQYASDLPAKSMGTTSQSSESYALNLDELQASFPELVVDMADPGLAEPGRESEQETQIIKGLKYNEMINVLIKAIQEQQAMIQTQQETIDQLQSQLSQVIQK